MRGFFGKNAIIGIAEIAGRLPLIFVAGYIARELGPEMYGNWALVLTFQGIAVALAGLGLPNSLSRLASIVSLARARSYMTLTVQVTALAVFAIFLVTLATQDWLATLLGMDEDTAWLLLVGCALVVTGVAEALMTAYFRSREMVWRAASTSLVRTAIELGAIVYVFGTQPFGYTGADLLTVYILSSLALKAIAYPLLVLVRNTGAERPPARDRREFLRYGLPMIPAALVIYLIARGDRIVLGHMFDKDALGVYAFGASIAAYMMFLGYAVNPLFLPRASVLYERGEHALVRRMFGDSQRVYLALFTITIVCVALFSREIIELTAGDAFLGAQAVMVLLAVRGGLDGLLGIWQWIFHLARRPSYVLWFNLVYLALTLVAVVSAALVGGPTTVAAALVASALVANGARYFLVRRLMPITTPPSVLIGLTILGLVVLPLAWAFNDAALLPRLVAAVAVAGAAALALRAAIGGIDPDQAEAAR